DLGLERRIAADLAVVLSDRVGRRTETVGRGGLSILRRGESAALALCDRRRSRRAGGGAGTRVSRAVQGDGIHCKELCDVRCPYGAVVAAAEAHARGRRVVHAELVRVGGEPDVVLRVAVGG